MTGDLLPLQRDPIQDRLARLSRRAEELPAEARDLVDEILENFAISIEELQVAAEELHHQNNELLAAREEVERQRQRYLDLFEFAPDGYLVTDPAGIIQEANRAALSQLAIPKDFLIGKPLVLYIAGEDRIRYHRYLDRIASAEAAPQVEWELSLQSREGEPFPAAITTTSIRDKEGALTGLRWLLRDLSASKRAEARRQLLIEARQGLRAAEKANRLLNALIDSMPVGAVIADAGGDVISLNKAGEEILGSDVHGHIEAPERTYEAFYPDGRPFPTEEMPLVRAIREGRQVSETELLIRHTDGSERTIMASAVPILDASGNIVSGITIFRDITDQKETQRILTRFMQRLRILHQADQVILKANSEEEIVAAVLPFIRQLLPCRRASVLAFDWEAGEAILLGVDTEEKTRLGKNRRLTLDERWPLEKLAREEMSLVEDISTLPLESALLAELQQEEIVSCLSVPLVAKGTILGTLNIALADPDVITLGQREVIRQLADQLAIGLRQAALQREVDRYTRQLEAMVARRTAALHASESRFRAVFESAPLGIAILDEHGRILSVNPALQRILGYVDNQLLERSVTAFIKGAEAVAVARQDYARLVSGDCDTYRASFDLQHRDGRFLHAVTILSRIQGVESQSPLIIALVDDVTEQVKTQNALIQTEKLALLSRLSASLAHEIKNPLQSVLGCLGLAQEMLLDRADVGAYLDIAMEELENVASIVTQLRDLSHTPEDIQREPAAMNALVERTLLLTRKHIQNKDIEVVWQPGEGLPPLLVIPDRIRQVFLNLILNAVEAMPEGGVLQVSTSDTRQPEGVSAIFSDNGVGIDPERIPLIFEPFHSTRVGGMGMGLFISKVIIQNHGGDILVDSQPGEGTTFTVWLPLGNVSDEDQR